MNDEENYDVDYYYRVDIVPKSYSEANKCGESKEWQIAMDCEMKSPVKN